MKLDKLPIAKITAFLTKHQYVIIGALILGLFVYTIGIINRQLSPERNQAAYDEALSSIESVKFNQEAVETIVRLRDLNVNVDAIFDPNRTNPFE